MAAALVFDRVTKEYAAARLPRSFREDLAGARFLPGRRRAPERLRALTDVSLEIEEGESFGLIGRNGAGKTTALKLATRITYPTAGRIRVRGRVGALIEVGTGMHPELTGRENVQLYGRILGLAGREIDRRFDEIVDFAGIGAAVDQPIKQFSSGMQLRLGFSIASHLEPDVLLVDEAIAVGDAGFQHRCVERMARLVRDGGTLVFVSHDMTAIESLCTRAVLLARGRVELDGRARDVVAAYLLSVEDELLEEQPAGLADEARLAIERVTLHDADGRELSAARAGEPLTIRLHYQAASPLDEPAFNVVIGDGRIGGLASASMMVDGEHPPRLHGRGHLDCTFLDLPLRPRVYEIWCGVRGRHGYGNVFPWQRLRRFRVEGDSAAEGKLAVSMGSTRAPLAIDYRWGFEGCREGQLEEARGAR